MRKKIEKNFWDTEIIGNRRKIEYNALFIMKFSPVSNFGDQSLTWNFNKLLLKNYLYRVWKGHGCKKCFVNLLLFILKLLRIDLKFIWLFYNSLYKQCRPPCKIRQCVWCLEFNLLYNLVICILKITEGLCYKKQLPQKSSNPFLFLRVCTAMNFYAP